MKFHIPLQFHLIFFILGIQYTVAQVPNYRLWGTTAHTVLGYGSIYSVNADGSDYQRVKVFEPNPDGSVPTDRLVKIPTGELYGLTPEGGMYDAGVIYKINEDGSGYTKIFDFSFETDIKPNGGLIYASNGYLYGVTAGQNSDMGGYGTIFRILPNGTDFSLVHQFDGTLGGAPYGGLLEASDGNLYGVTTFRKSAPNQGTIFKINLDGNDFGVVHYFNEHDKSSRTALIEGKDGSLYGETGGASRLFKVKKDGSDYKILHEFGIGNDGISLLGSPLQLANGDLVGIATNGGMNNKGVLFSIEPDGANYTRLYEFDVMAQGSLILGSDGRLYGVADPLDLGIVFSIKIDGSEFNKIFVNADLNQGKSFTNLIEATPGVFICVARLGAASNNGAIGKLTSSGHYTKLKDFYQEGEDPRCALVQASDGDLYGVTTAGGTHGAGIIYKIKKDGSGYKKLMDFDGINGREPVGNLLELPDGFLYGTTKRGGVHFDGNIYKIRPDGSEFSTIKYFEFNEPGPGGTLILGDDGLLYGVTSDNITSQPGTLYKIHPDGTGYTVILDFSAIPSSFGTYPVGIRQGADGYLYGISVKYDLGIESIIFKIKTDGSDLQKLKELGFEYLPYASGNIPLLASNGLFYGTGFENNSIYVINSDGSEFSSYTDPSIINSHGDLIELEGGNLFGTSRIGIFQFNINSAAFQNLSEGWNSWFKIESPQAGLLAIEKQSQTITFEELVEKTEGEPEFTLTAISSSGLPVTFTSSNTAVATIEGNVVKIVNAGSTTITARQSGTMDVSAAEEQQILTVTELVTRRSNEPLNEKMKIFPNPSNSLLFFQLPDSHSKVSAIVLYDITGRIYDFDVIATDDGCHVNVQHLPPGLYHIKITQDHKIYYERFIKG
ncbi:MAG TPA: choice-of-anchor tandem repeat GloVer-containing protein [Ohtaekwangia sp.]|nr:choice-of-anchor tandem repeat GloVer-containing protein [Ohtaekwangia sp.]